MEPEAIFRNVSGVLSLCSFSVHLVFSFFFCFFFFFCPTKKMDSSEAGSWGRGRCAADGGDPDGAGHPLF